MVFQENKTQEMFEGVIAALVGIKTDVEVAAGSLDDRKKSMRHIKDAAATADRQRRELIIAMWRWQRAGKPDFLSEGT